MVRSIPTTQYHACVAFATPAQPHNTMLASRSLLAGLLLQPHHTTPFLRRVPCKQGAAPVLYTSSACVTRCN